MRFLAALLLSLCCACSTCLMAIAPDRDADVRAMMDSTVRIQVVIEYEHQVKDANTGEKKTEPGKTGWSGSGFVYEKTNGETSGPRSRIMTANHVLDAPKRGERYLSEELMDVVTVTDVTMTVLTEDGRTCGLVPLVLGQNTTEDVATGEADCDAGTVAHLASSVPARGAKVYVSGHSLGVSLTLITEGFVSGWYGDGFLLVSAPAAPGNSGGPVFYNGEVVGLLVRGATSYPHISQVTPLKACLDRVKATPPL